MAVLHDRIERFADAVELGLGRRQPVEGCVGVGHDGGQRLIDLVGDRRGELAQRRHAGHVRKLRLRLLQRLRRPRVLGEVAGDRERGVDSSRIRSQWRIRRRQVPSAGRRGKPADEAGLLPPEASVEIWLVRLLEGRHTRERVDAHPDDLLGRQFPAPLEGRVDALISVISPDDVDGVG